MTQHRTTLTAATLILGAFVLGTRARAQVCTFVSGPDVIVGDLTSPSNYASEGSLEALSMGTTSCNLGDEVLDWIAGDNNHPVIAQNLYRYQDMGGWFAFEQVGLSWLKHGFAALDLNACCSNCADTDGSHLGVGCSDPYSGGLNGSQGSLGPRWQVNAASGVFVYPPADPAWSGSTARRLEVEIAELEATASSSTRYFGEGHYVTPDDAAAGHQNNNASYREVSVSGSGSAWSFGYIGGTQRESQAIRAWQDIDPSVSEVEIDLAIIGQFPPATELLILASKVTDLGGGTWHYEYALYNMTSDDGISGFTLPVPDGVDVTNVGFHDVTYRNGDGIGNANRSGADWTALHTSGTMAWTTASFETEPNGNALRWGSTYNFRFDANTAPQTVDLELTRFQSGQLHTVPGVDAPSPAGPPGVAFCDASDGALALCPCANPGDPTTGCDIAQATGGVEAGVSAFTPDGMGGGTASFHGSGFAPAGNPTVTLIRSPNRELPPVAFGDGLRCLAAQGLLRITSGTADGGTIDLGISHGAGAGTFAYQMWFRNQPGSFCTPDAFNLSNGYELVW